MAYLKEEGIILKGIVYKDGLSLTLAVIYTFCYLLHHCLQVIGPFKYLSGEWETGSIIILKGIYSCNKNNLSFHNFGLIILHKHPCTNASKANVIVFGDVAFMVLITFI